MPGREQVRAAVIGLIVAYVLHHLCPRRCLAKKSAESLDDGGVGRRLRVTELMPVTQSLKGAGGAASHFTKLHGNDGEKWSPEPEGKANRRPCG